MRFTLGVPFRIFLCGLCLLFTGCTTEQRAEFTLSDQRASNPSGFVKARLADQAPDLSEQLEKSLREDLNVNPNRELSILTLSGGGAEGAFGAGLLTGWTKAGTRPQFSLVTGVSTGALIAPFAYLGPAYDDKLREAYTSGITSDILKKKGVLALFSPGVYSSSRLEALVAHFVDVPLIEALAIENNKRRKLVVATTDLDTQSVVIWDLGNIASDGVASGTLEGKIKARDLIRQILVASASIPGAFPPQMIASEVEANGRKIEIKEMHVDGAVSMPFFILPESLLSWSIPADLSPRGHVYVIINGNIDPEFSVTKYGTVSVAVRSLDTLTRAQARTTLLTITDFAARNHLGITVASIPSTYVGANLMAFDKPSMQRLFDEGYAEGRAGKFPASKK